LARIVREHDDVELVYPVHLNPNVREPVMRILDGPRIHLIEPVDYPSMVWLMDRSHLIITDSGGIQEETTFLGVPCLTMRENTERPVTVTLGTNVLVGNDLQKLDREVRRILSGRIKPGNIPPLWDGNAGERIARILAQQFSCEPFPAESATAQATTQ